MSLTAYLHAAEDARRPRRDRGDRELVRMATLAASSHNTQPWRFELLDSAIVIHPDLTRRCPVVDPLDAHLFKSLGCAAENLVQAAAAQGRAADVDLDEASGTVTVHLDGPHQAPTVDRDDAVVLAQAILTRQCTRGDYDGSAVSSEQLRLLGDAGSVGTARCELRTGHAALEAVAGLVSAGNLVQLRDDAFRRELVEWIRFNPKAALRTGDGLAGPTTSQPAAPTWFGRALQRVLLSAERQAKLDAGRLAGSAGIAAFVTSGDDRRHWVDAGRAYQRFALRAESIDVRTAFVNQPIEVAALRPDLESWLGLNGERVQLMIRFGHGAKLPFSLRRPLEEVLAGP